MPSSRSIPLLLLVMMTAIGWPGIVLADVTPIPPDPAGQDEQADRRLDAMYWEYEQDLPRLMQPGQQSVLASWESRFKKALADQEGSRPLRLRAMEALGTVQSALGKIDDALETYEEMEKYAKQEGCLESEVAAGYNQLDLIDSKPLESILQTVERIRKSAETFVNQRNDAAARATYADVLYRIGALLATRAMALDRAEDSTNLLKQAKSTLQKSVALADYGTTPPATRMYWLAQTQSRLGFREEAAAIYDGIAGMQGTGFSRLWIEYLRICETTKRDGPEYRAAIEQALAAFRERGGTDEYELSLRRQLGRSYRAAGQYAKSTEILTGILGQGDDPDAQAYDMLVIAQNTRDSKDIGMACRLLQEAVAKYPNTGAGQTAKVELQKPLYRQYVLESQPEHGKSWRGIVLGVNLAAIALLVTVLIARQVKKRSRRAG